MSWIDKINSDFIITTGDGKDYRPQWLNASMQMDFNVSEFEFPNLDGTLVNRQRRKGFRYALEIFFQGDDHLDTSEAFRASANDNRVWNITHPFYGTLIVQPLSLFFDNTQYNISKITGMLIETITEDNPKTTVDPVDNITLDKQNNDETFIAAFDVTPSSADINTLSSTNSNIYKRGSKYAVLQQSAEDYFNAFNTANAAINNATAKPLDAMRATQAVINAPALFQISVNNRLILLTSQFALLRGTVSTIIDRSSKKIYEVNAGSLISALCIAAINPIAGDYGNRNAVLFIAQQIIGNYNNYLLDLDTLETENGGSPTSYIPDAGSLIGLSTLVSNTISSLFTIALSSKQERSIICEKDTNIIILTHRLYSLDPFDNNINELILNNNIGLYELTEIKKGREIVYYI